VEHLSQHIESLIFAAEQPVTLKEIKTCLEETFQTKFKRTDLADTVQGLMKKYENDGFSFEIIEIAEGYQFLTKGAYHNSVGTMLKQKTKKRLSRAALETLSISSDAPGRPLLYGTSEKFMDYFGIKSIKDLPKLKDFKTADSEIGEAASADETVAEAIADNLPATTENVPLADEAALEAPKDETLTTDDTLKETPLVDETKTEAVVDNSPTTTENVPLADEASPETQKDETLIADDTPKEVPLADEIKTEVPIEDTPITDNIPEETTDSPRKETTTILANEEIVALSEETTTDEEE